MRGVDLFLDGPEASVRDALRVIFAGEKVRSREILPNPDVLNYDWADGFRVLSLEPLVQMELTAFRDKNRTHPRDLLDLGLIDGDCVQRFLPELGERVQLLIDTPED